jgi:predicted nucleic acid-binding protein
VIVLDTNVVSELMRENPSAAVVRWVTKHADASVFTTSITQGEVLRGVELLPPGRRRNALAAAAAATFDEDFRGRILAFDPDSAKAYALIAAGRRRSGRPISTFDAQIAAIARAHGASVATRNIDDFQHCGVDVIDPWHP